MDSQQPVNNALRMIMDYCNNHFNPLMEKGSYAIVDKIIELKRSYRKGSFILIRADNFNEVIYEINDVQGNQHNLSGDVVDDIFTGTVYIISPPRDFIAIAKNVAAYIENTRENTANGIISESNSGYSYSLASGKDGGILSWVGQFSGALTNYKRVNKDI